MTPDAVSLSKQGDVGDRLIPKLRAVDTGHAEDARFDSDAFDRDELQILEDDAETELASGLAEDHQIQDDTQPAARPRSAATEAAVRAGHPSTASIPGISTEDEFARRREMAECNVQPPEPEQQDLGQTADLLDALRRRRGAREENHLVAPGDSVDEDDSESGEPAPLRGIGGWRAESEQAVSAHSPAESATEPPASPAPNDQQKTAPDVSDRRPAEPAKRGKRALAHSKLGRHSFWHEKRSTTRASDTRSKPFV